MPGKRISELTALSGANSANNDDVIIFDTTASETKRISRSQLAEGMIDDLPFLYFHGVLTADPTQRFNGDSLELGDGYLRSSDMIFRYYTSSGWQNYEQISVAAAQAWAEGTLPGGAGTYSSKEWSETSEAWAVNPENTAVEPNKYSALHYAAKAQGYANVAGAAVGFIDREDQTTLLADTSLTYTAGQAGTVSAGDVIRTRTEGFAYIVAASAASDQHITTAGGVKMYEANPFTSKARLKRMVVSSLSNGATVMAAGATYRWDSTIAVQVHQADTTEYYYVAPNAAADGAWVRDTNKPEVSAFDQIKMRMKLGRVDFVGIGDSNQGFGGNGWDYGLMYALTQSGFPMYATGLISMNENNSDGVGFGYGYSYNASAPVIGVNTGAPTFFDDYMAGVPIHQYGYLAAGSTYGLGGNSGIILGENAGVAGLIDISAELQIDCYYGTFASGSGGSFNPSIRRDSPPYNTLASNGSITTTTGVDGVEVASFTLAAGSRAGFGSLGFKWNGADIVGPFFGTYARISQTGRTTGFSYSTLTYLGGYSLRAMANTYLNIMSDTAIAHFLGEMRRLQGDQKTVVITVNSGLNDRNETGTSLGPAGITDGDSYQAFVDNFVAIQNRIEGIWVAEGWDLSELFWLVFPSHPVDDPDDAELVSYRKAIGEYLMTRPNAQMLNLAELTDEAEMLASGYYASGGADRNHLTSTGYAQLGIKMVKVMK
jgi:hypothetical protein